MQFSAEKRTFVAYYTTMQGLSLSNRISKHSYLNMKTKVYHLTLLAALAGTAYAAPRSQQEARALAQTFIEQQLGHKATLTEAFRAPQSAPGYTGQRLAPFYAFNDETAQAFVLISGSDLMPELLGYGDQGNFPADLSQLPQNLQSWLQYVAEVEQYLEEHPEAATTMERRQASTEPITPMLTTEWGQDDPYYDLCPEKDHLQTVTGCMATSVSQVLNYHEYPTQFTGTYTYYDSGKKRTIDFNDVTIDYSLLLDKYSRGAGTDEERHEVAKLMVNVGYALSMQYGTNAEGGSGAVATMGDRGFHENMGCNKSQALERNFYSLTEWNQILQEELREGRPVVFGGHSSEGGHSFVLDGLDDKGMYHVNWGWDGYYQGFFDVSVLHPESVGTGATASSDGYINMQHIFVNLCDPAKAGRWRSQIVVPSGGITTSTTSTVVGGSITFKGSVLNKSYDPFKGKVGVVLMQNGQVIDRKMSTTTTSISSTRMETNSYGGYSYVTYGDKNISYSYATPANLADGEYQAYMCVQPQDSTDYDLVRCIHTRTSYRTLVVADGKITVKGDAVGQLVEVTGWNFDNEQLLTAPETVTAYLRNISAEAVSYTYWLHLTSPEGKRQNDVASPVITLEPGEEGEVSFPFTFTSVGEWSAELRGADLCVSRDKVYSFDFREFEVGLDPTQGAIFSITKKVEGTDEKIYNVGEVSFQFSVENKGTDYDGKMSVRLFSSKTSSAAKNLLAEVCNPVQVGGGETKQVILTGDLNMAQLTAEKATVYARIYYLRGEEMEQIGTSATAVTIWRKDQDEAIHTIMADPDAPASVFDLQGRKLDHQTHQGLIIVNGQKQLIR